jgi:hypothetical protein
MRPLLLAFAPAQTGVAHPGPWKSLPGHSGHDVTIELHISSAYDESETFDSLNVAWWIVSLLRLRTASRLLAPFVSFAEFSDLKESIEDKNAFSLETGRTRIAIGESKNPTIEDLDWLKLHWQDAARTMTSNNAFNLAYQAIDQGAFSGDTNLYLLSIWSALEALFSPDKAELRFRVSSLIAAYLEPAGRERLSLQKEIAKLYDARSAIVHGTSKTSPEVLIATHQIARTVLLKMIDDGTVPTKTQLEERLFGLTKAT